MPERAETSRSYRICIRCVMDTSDPDIHFDAEGLCSHCRNFERLGRPILERARSAQGALALERLVARMKVQGARRDYDCVIGISGGVDSTYVALKVKELGLRPLAVHFDSGWNSELAVSNIENIVKTLGIDLHTFVADWEEMRDLQLAFFKAGVANCDIPQDHAFLAVLYRSAARHGIKYILSGGNVATEFILPTAWGYNASDLRHLRAIQRRFGTMRLRHYPTLGFWRRYLYYPYVNRIRVVRLLDYMPYEKEEAKRVIAERLAWRDYGGKHYESLFTRFFQAYYLPMKFGFDKRRAHLSSLIVTGQLTREQALAELSSPPESESRLLAEKEFVAKKLGLREEQFDRILQSPGRNYDDYPSNAWLFALKDRFVARLRSSQA
jgi:N-acetyl sugar amidotransferase